MTQRNATEDEDAVDTAWVDALSRKSGPRYLQVADAMEQAVADGRLRPGDRLPPQRRLAQQLGVDLTTVTRAYEEAKRRHLLVARGARGSYVAAPRVELARVVDLGMNMPPPPASLDLDELVRRGTAQLLRHADTAALMGYQLGGGGPADREAGVQWLRPMLGTVAAERVVTCPGAQSALMALILALTGPGEAILCEPWVYPGLRAAAEQAGRRLVAVDADAGGMRPDALEKACREHGARVVYLNPTLQNPTTATMPEPRRRAIAGALDALGLQLIEDDPYWRLADRAPPPIAGMAPDRTCYLATLSKCLTPGLRTAFMVVPDTAVRERFLRALRAFALMSPPLATGLATQWILDGSAERLLAGVRAEARARQDLAARILLAAHARAERDGIHLWLPMPAPWTSAELARAARLEGLAVVSGDAFAVGARDTDAIRISLGGVKERAQLAEALRRLAGLLSRQASGTREVVV